MQAVATELSATPETTSALRATACPESERSRHSEATAEFHCFGEKSLKQFVSVHLFYNWPLSSRASQEVSSWGVQDANTRGRNRYWRRIDS